MTQQDNSEQLTILRNVEALFKTHLWQLDFRRDRTRGYWFKKTSPYLHMTARILVRKSFSHFNAGRRVIFPWTVFNKILLPREIKRIKAIWTTFENEPLHDDSMFMGNGGVCLSFCEDTPRTTKEFDKFKRKVVSYFEDTVIPFFERYRTIDEYCGAFESQELSLSSFDNSSSADRQALFGCYYFQHNERQEALNRFKAARSRYLDGDNLQGVEIFSLLIKRLKEAEIIRAPTTI